MKVKKWLWPLVAGVLVFGAVLAFLGVFSEPEPEEPVRVQREGTYIIYDGPLAQEGIEQVKQLYDPSITRLVINSAGGEINLGMDLGEWVFDQQLDVEVRGHAFSSAANYVFTAGKNKYLHADSMVGWHGGATQDEQPWFMRLMMKRYLAESQAREQAFFKKIGVDQRSTVYGQNPQFKQYEGYVGWTYSLKAMAQLGIRQIQLIDGQWHPADTYEGKKIFTVEQID